MDDFAVFLHDPLNNKFLTDEEHEKIKIFKDKENGGSYNCIEHLKLLLSDFTNKQLLHENGLVKYYNLLASVVNDNDYLGLILIGAKLDDTEDVFLSNYIRMDNTKIKLTIKTVCYYLIRDYLTKDL